MRSMLIALLVVVSSASFGTDIYLAKASARGKALNCKFLPPLSKTNFAKLIKEAKFEAFSKAEDHCEDGMIRIGEWKIKKARFIPKKLPSFLPCYDYAAVSAKFYCY